MSRIYKVDPSATLFTCHTGYIGIYSITYQWNLYFSGMKQFLLAAICLLFVFSCSVNPYSKTNRDHKKQARQLSRELRKTPLPAIAGPSPFFVASTNFNLRKPSYVILHHTAQNSCEQTLRTFTLKRTSVSAHYVICKSGLVYQMLNDHYRAWHAGNSRWGNVTDLNSTSIGIELDNNGFEPFSDEQISSLLTVLDTLKKRYAIPPQNFIGHADIAPRRKIDPNIYFPWQQLADRGFGLWYADTTGTQIPDQYNALYDLQFIGYDIRDSVAAVRAFKQKFMQDTVTVLNEADHRALISLTKQYREARMR